MRVAGIISEFNPFHKGHRHLVDTVRSRLQPEGIVTVMSGSFVQRGEPAMWDKWTRASCALENGVDLVLELPVCYAVNGAAEFALGGVGILQGIGIVTDIAFGSESGDRAALEGAAEALVDESPLFEKRIRESLREGIPYPAAYERAALGEDAARAPILEGILAGSNDILALEYIKQMKRFKAGFDILPVKRLGAVHDQADPVQGHASAGSIRRMIEEGASAEKWGPFLPEETLGILASGAPFGPREQDRYFALLRHVLITRDAAELASLVSVGEGLENRLKQAVIRAGSTDEMIRSVKSKRYTYARISRILVQALLSMDRSGYERIRKEKAFYARVLGFSPAGAKLLRVMGRESNIPVFTNIRQADGAGEEILDSLAWDCLASDTYSILSGTDIYQGSDRVRKPCVKGTQTEKICTPDAQRV